MKAIELYNRLENDFVSNDMWDEWAKYMGEIEDYLSPNFKERSMGLVCDFTENVTKVYTAVFPSETVMNRILADGATDVMLFVHHAAIWDIRRPSPFYQMDRGLLGKLKENRISIFNFHVPLDNFSEFSTTKTLADALGIEVEKPFAEYRGALAGIFGRTSCKTVEELNAVFAKATGHQTKLYLYGESLIQDGRIAVVAGGGNDMEIVPELLKHSTRVLVTGITVENEFSANVHCFEKDNHINVLGGTHYSTEKFACQKMCAYFERLGLPSVFIEEIPVYEDM
jgi:putative NIF3 family GTP cyclohydrolase 1 type 2